MFVQILLCFLLAHKVTSQFRDDVSDRVVNEIENMGYPGEVHDVQTEDGYILKMHRIPNGVLHKYIFPPDGINVFERLSDSVKNVINSRNRPAVLIMHGLFCSSADWIVGGPEKGLAYILADAGFDVWMGNARGNVFSRRHLHYNPENDKFWKFSWHEIGIYDLPAMINYILEQTNSNEIHYVGHSQGITTLLVLTSMKPRYNSKIRSVNAMAPVAFLSNINNPIVRGMASFVDEIDSIASSIGVYELGRNSKLTKIVGTLLCDDISVTQELCAQALFASVGFNSDQLNRTLLPEILQNIPAGISSRQFIHFGQLIKSKKFQMFDYREAGKNLLAYGLTFPPEYILSNVKTEMAIYFGGNDNLLSPKDVYLLTDKLGSDVVKYQHLISSFNHVDFLFGIDANKMVYNKIIEMIRETISN